MSSKTIGRLQLSATIAQQINDMIIRRKLEPGTRLPSENQLAEQYRVSRPTIREAMKTLKAQNVVVIRQGDGTFVSDQTGMADDPLGLRYIESGALVEGVFEARLLIEPQIAMLAAARASEDELEQIGLVAAQMQTTNYRDPARSILDINFHTLISKSCKNAIFDKFMPVIFETIEKGVVILYESEENHIRSQQMHREIYEALVRRDVWMAKSATETHIYSAYSDIKEMQAIQGRRKNK